MNTIASLNGKYVCGFTRGGNFGSRYRKLRKYQRDLEPLFEFTYFSCTCGKTAAFFASMSASTMRVKYNNFAYRWGCHQWWRDA